jgi:uncharacterized Ntn-hydrolase superfamily protein
MTPVQGWGGVRTLAVVLLALSLCGRTASPALATWSIVAVDEHTHEVGIAGASCIGGSEVIAALVPGKGALAAQAMSNLKGRDLGARMLAAGATPDDIVRTITSAEFDSFFLFDLYPWRQYGVVSLKEGAAPAHYTGEWTFAWSGGRSADSVSVQGNTLYGPEVVDASLAAFQSLLGDGVSTLADRLMAALVAGAEAGGDCRCTRELSALSAFITVARPYDDPQRPWLRLVETREGEESLGSLSALLKEIRRNLIAPESGTAAENPVLLLQDRYLRWRAREDRNVVRGRP